MKGDNQKDLVHENLKRISANFELELLRLIRTLNFISQSKELYKDQIDYFQSQIDKYKLGLKDFTIKLLEAERESNESRSTGRAESPYTAPTESPPVSAPLVNVIDELREYLDEISNELERSKTAYIKKLDSVHSLYNLELGASQKELDVKLQRLQKEMTRITESEVQADAPKKEQTAGATTYDYVKPSRADAKAEQAKPEAETKDNLEKKQTKPLISEASTPPKSPMETMPSDKQKPIDGSDKYKEKESKIKGAYVAGAGLLILGVIVGVLFYDMLLKRWMVDEYTVIDSIEAFDTPDIPDEGQTTESMTSDELSDAEPGSEITEENESLTLTEEEAEIPPAEARVNETQSEEAEELPGGGEIETSPSSLPDTPLTDAITYTVKGPGGNVRNGPGMNYDVVSVVKGGEEFHGTGEKRGRWVKIVTPDGSRGWISGKIITEVK